MKKQNGPIKKLKIKPVSKEEKTQDYADRLAELETELKSYPSRAAADRVLSSIQNPSDALSGKEKVIQFQFNGKTYATGHDDQTFAASNHAHGVRHISFYEKGKVVLRIEGDFEDQQFGSNFKYHYTEICTAGEWEADFIKLSDDLRHHNEKRKLAFRKKRASQKYGHAHSYR